MNNWKEEVQRRQLHVNGNSFTAYYFFDRDNMADRQTYGRNVNNSRAVHAHTC